MPEQEQEDLVEESENVADWQPSRKGPALPTNLRHKEGCTNDLLKRTLRQVLKLEDVDDHRNDTTPI